VVVDGVRLESAVVRGEFGRRREWVVIADWSVMGEGYMCVEQGCLSVLEEYIVSSPFN